MKMMVTGLLAGLAMAAVAHPAVASPIRYTISGTVIAGNDASGLFGGGSLAGTAFAVVETFDPAKAQSSWIGTTGSSANGNTSQTHVNFADVALTIGTVTRTFADTTSSLSATAGAQFTSNVQTATDDLNFSIQSGRIKADYTAPNAIGGLVDRYAGSYTVKDGTGNQTLWANFEVNGLSAVSAVPLPASAPLFGAGLVMLAAGGLRHRRLRAVVAAR